MDLLVSYFETFGEKPVSTSDMQLFLPFLESTDYAEFRDRIKATIKVGPDDVPLTVCANVSRLVPCVHHMISMHTIRVSCVRSVRVFGRER